MFWRSYIFPGLFLFTVLLLDEKLKWAVGEPQAGRIVLRIPVLAEVILRGMSKADEERQDQRPGKGPKMSMEGSLRSSSVSQVHGGLYLSNSSAYQPRTENRIEQCNHDIVIKR